MASSLGPGPVPCSWIGITAPPASSSRWRRKQVRDEDRRVGRARHRRQPGPRRGVHAAPAGEQAPPRCTAEHVIRPASRCPASCRCTLDITSADDVAAAAAAAGDVTLLINNAGISTGTGMLATDALDGAHREFDTNVFGPLAMSRAFAPILGANGGGAIVNVLSVLSWLSMPQTAMYSAAKAAAWSLTNSWRVELAGQGTLVVGVHVGFMDTDMAAGVEAPKVSPESVVEATLEALRTGPPEVLADDASRFVKSQLSSDLSKPSTRRWCLVTGAAVADRPPARRPHQRPHPEQVRCSSSPPSARSWRRSTCRSSTSRSPTSRRPIPMPARRRCHGSSPPTRSCSARCSSSAAAPVIGSAASASSWAASSCSCSARSCAASHPTSATLVGARALQGIGAAFLVPASVALLIAAYPPERRMQIVAQWGGIGALAVATGPSLGAAIVSAGGWRWAFFVNIPVGLFVLIVGRRALTRIPRRRRVEDARLPRRGPHVAVAGGTGARHLGRFDVGLDRRAHPQRVRRRARRRRGVRPPDPATTTTP